MPEVMTEETYSQDTQEIMDLKKRYNILVGAIKEKDGVIKALREDQESREKILLKETMIFLRSFGKVIANLEIDDKFISYARQSKYANYYIKTNQEDFDNYIKSYSQIEKQKFIDLCIDLGFVKSETNRKCTYKNENTFMYLIAKPAAMMLKELNT